MLTQIGASLRGMGRTRGVNFYDFFLRWRLRFRPRRAVTALNEQAFSVAHAPISISISLSVIEVAYRFQDFEGHSTLGY